MEGRLNIADFCIKHQIKRGKLDYQIRRERIKRDEDKKFDEKEMLKLLRINNTSDVEIQHLKEQLAQVQEQLEPLNSCNKTDVEIQHLRDEITQLNEKVAEQANLIKKQSERERFRSFSLLAAINIGLLLHPKTRSIGYNLPPIITSLLQTSDNKTE